MQQQGYRPKQKHKKTLSALSNTKLIAIGSVVVALLIVALSIYFSTLPSESEKALYEKLKAITPFNEQVANMEPDIPAEFLTKDD